MGYYEEQKLKDKITDLEKTVTKLNPIVSGFNTFKQNVQNRTGIDADALNEALRLMQTDENELITNQLKQLFSTVRLVYAEEIAAEQKRQNDRRHDMEKRREAEKAAEAKRQQTVRDLDKANRAALENNLRLMTEEANETLRAFRTPVSRDSIAQSKFTEITELCLNSGGKLQMERVGFLWQDVIVRGGLASIKLDDPIYQFYEKRGLKGFKALIDIPDNLYYGSDYYMMGFMRGMGSSKDKRYFTRDY